MEQKGKETGIEICRWVDSCGEIKRAWKGHAPLYEHCVHYYIHGMQGNSYWVQCEIYAHSCHLFRWVGPLLQACVHQILDAHALSLKHVIWTLVRWT